MSNFNRDGKKGGFNKGGFGGGKPSFQKKSWGNDSDRERQMFSAKCSDCGNNCEVPFRPTNGKPVRCNDCFDGQRDNNDSRGGRFNDRAPRREFNNDRPAFRGAEPRAPYVAPATDNGETKRALAEITAKLDRLVTVIEAMTTVKPVVAPAPKAVAKPAVKKAAPKVVAKKAVTPVVAKVAKEKAPAKKVVAKKVAPAKKAPAKKAAPKKK